MEPSTSPRSSPDPPSPVPCPRCLAKAARFLAPVSHVSGQPFYQCEKCEYVWPLRAMPAPALDTPDSSDESS